MADSECLVLADLEPNLFNNLCDELVAEILVRLPTTAAVGFQVVCKRWYSIISSPYFIARFVHLRHHRRDVQSSIVVQVSYYCALPDCNLFHSDFQIISDHCSSSRKLYVESVSFLPCSPKDHHKVILEASCADLILCSYTTARPKRINYYVSNLLTRQWVLLPPPPAYKGSIKGVVVGFLCVPPPCSQCKPMDSRSHHKFKFMVVRLLISEPLKVQLFSSEDTHPHQWRTLVVSSPRLQASKFHPAMMSYFVAYRGMLHWLNDDCIMVYDPLNTPQTLSRIIHLPIQPPLSNNIWRSSCFAVCQGRLRLVLGSDEDAGDHALDVWELGDYDSGLWNFVHKVDLKTVAYNCSLPIGEGSLWSILFQYSVVSLHPENGDVVYLRALNGVVSVNMKSRMVEQFYPLKENPAIMLGKPVMGCIKAVQLAHQWWPTPVSSLLH